MEFVWKTSPSLASMGPTADLFTLKTFNGYGPPDGFCFDVVCDAPPIQADPLLEDVNIKERADAFVAAAKNWASVYTSNNVMMTMGSDFQYQAANMWFKNLDLLMGYIQDNAAAYGVDIFYSTPQNYAAYVHAANLTYTYKTDDFFPYADAPAAYWSGYFTSRPALKRYVRSNSAYLRLSRQLEAAAMAASPSGPVGSTDGLWDAVSVLQHHDAVAGTEKQHVANDYAKQLYIGHAHADALTSDALARLTERSYSGLVFDQCRQANVSICAATQGVPARDGPGVVVVLYNQLATATSVWHRLPVDSTEWAVVNATSAPVPAQIVVNPPPLPGRPTASKYTLVFHAADLPPMGYATFFLVPASSAAPAATLAARADGPPNPVGNAHFELTFRSDGLLAAYTDKARGRTTKLVQRLAYYNASAGGEQPHPPVLNEFQASGAYIFRPNSSALFSTGHAAGADISVQNGSFGVEILQRFSDWAYQQIFVYAGELAPTVEYTIGPVPIADADGKEVVTVFASELDSGANWHSDANAREMIARRRNYRATWQLNCTQAIACNYVPVNTAMYLEDDAARLTLVTDRSNGGSSMASGELELMIHRRLLFDDARGVGEALNETGITGNGLIIRARHMFHVGSPESGADFQRPAVARITYEPTAFFAPLTGTPAEWAVAHRTAWSGLSAPLPPNVFLQTLQLLDPTTVLLRLSHRYALGESAKWSRPATVNTTGLFTAFSITAWTELALTANQPVANLRSRFVWNSSGGPEAAVASPLHSAVNRASPFRPSPHRPDRGYGTGPSVELLPMETRTFELVVEWKHEA